MEWSIHTQFGKLHDTSAPRVASFHVIPCATFTSVAFIPPFLCADNGQNENGQRFTLCVFFSQVRDASLEVIALLAGMSDNLRSRVGAMPGCVRTLARFVISSSPGNRVDAQVGKRFVAAAATIRQAF